MPNYVTFSYGEDTRYILTAAEYKIGYYMPGAVWRATTGRPFVQAHAYDAIREFTLRWNAVTHGNVAALETVYGWLTQGDVLFTDPQENVWTVIRHPQQDKITFKMVKHHQIDTYWLWETELKMVESV